MTPLNDNEEEEFRQLWRDHLREKHGSEAVPVEVRLSAADALIKYVTDGSVIYHGHWNQLNGAHFDRSSAAALRAGGSRRRSPTLVIVLAAVVFMLLAGGLITFLELNKRPPVAARGGPGAPVGAVPGSPTPAQRVAPTAGDPLQLELAGHSFPVRSGSVVAGVWQVQPGADHLTWLAGATTNWSFFLDAQDSTAAPLRGWTATISAGLPVTLTLAGAPARHFRVNSAAHPGHADQVDLLGPQAAGFTLGVRTGAGDDALLLIQGREPTKGGEAHP